MTWKAEGIFDHCENVLLWTRKIYWKLTRQRTSRKELARSGYWIWHSMYFFQRNSIFIWEKKRNFEKWCLGTMGFSLNCAIDLNTFSLVPLVSNITRFGWSKGEKLWGFFFIERALKFEFRSNNKSSMENNKKANQRGNFVLVNHFILRTKTCMMDDKE